MGTKIGYPSQTTTVTLKLRLFLVEELAILVVQTSKVRSVVAKKKKKKLSVNVSQLDKYVNATHCATLLDTSLAFSYNELIE